MYAGNGVFSTLFQQCVRDSSLLGKANPIWHTSRDPGGYRGFSLEAVAFRWEHHGVWLQVSAFVMYNLNTVSKSEVGFWEILCSLAKQSSSSYPAKPLFSFYG